MAALRDEVTAMGFSGDGGLMGVGFANGRLVVLEYPSMKLLAEWRWGMRLRESAPCNCTLLLHSFTALAPNASKSAYRFMIKAPGGSQ